VYDLEPESPLQEPLNYVTKNSGRNQAVSDGDNTTNEDSNIRKSPKEKGCDTLRVHAKLRLADITSLDIPVEQVTTKFKVKVQSPTPIKEVNGNGRVRAEGVIGEIPPPVTPPYNK